MKILALDETGLSRVLYTWVMECKNSRLFLGALRITGAILFVIHTYRCCFQLRTLPRWAIQETEPRPETRLIRSLSLAAYPVAVYPSVDPEITLTWLRVHTFCLYHPRI